MRVLVTGSRDWDIKYKIDMILNEIFALADVLNSPLTIVHGSCPTGADRYVEQWAAGRDFVKVEGWPADWKKYGKGAGPRRNELMVEAGADMCVAFLKDGSLGTRQTIALARNAKIPTYVIDYALEEEALEILSPGPG